MRNNLDEEIGPSPVSTIDLDTVVAAGRRRARLRSLTVLAAGAAGLTAVAMGTFLALPAHQPPAPSPSLPGAQEQAEEQRLADVLSRALTQAVPGIRVDAYAAMASSLGDPRPSPPVDDIAAAYRADARLTAGALAGALIYRAVRYQEPRTLDSADATCEHYEVSGPGAVCTVTVGAEGEHILTMSRLDGDVVDLTVLTYWSDGTVMLILSNAEPYAESTGAAADPGRSVATTPILAAYPPLTLDQLAAVGANHDLVPLR